MDLQTKGKDEIDIHNISQAVRQMPRYQDKLKGLSVHTDIAEKLMKIFREESLMVMSLCYLTMYYNVDREGGLQSF